MAERTFIKTLPESLLKGKESLDIEFKSASGGFPQSFWETYSAFANTEGGIIILGIKEKDGAFYLDGLTDEAIEIYQKTFWSGANNRNKVNRNLLKNADVKISNISGHKILEFQIPQASFTDRPIYCGYDPYSGTYKRNFEGDYKCTAEEVRRMFADSDTTKPADSRIIPGVTLQDLDSASIEQYRRICSTAKQGHPWLSLDNENLLIKLGAYRTDLQTGAKGVTLAGLIMFGKWEIISNPNCIPNFFPDYREIPDNADNIRWIDRVCPDGTWESNLFQFYRRVLPKLQEVLPKPFRLEGNTRIDETSGHVAIREAFVNFCIHADFSSDAPMVIRRYPDRVIFSNPGTLLVSKEQYFNGNNSICRNKSIQQMFMMLGASEKAGSGVDKIMTGWKDMNWKRPYLETKSRPDKVELTMSFESILPLHIQDKLSAIFGEDVLNIGTNELAVLALACEEGEITHDRIRYAVDMHKSDISDMLADLCKRNILEGYGHGRGKKYHLFGEKVATLNAERLQPNSNKVATSRLKKDVLRDKILEACEDYITLETIAEKVGKRPDYLRNKILKSMIAEGLIERLHPAPNHPEQKYRKV